MTIRASSRIAGLLTSTLLAGAGSAVVARGARADTYPDNSSGTDRLPDNREHTFVFTDQYDGASPRSYARAAMQNLDSQTVMTDART